MSATVQRCYRVDWCPEEGRPPRQKDFDVESEAHQYILKLKADGAVLIELFHATTILEPIKIEPRCPECVRTGPLVKNFDRKRTWYTCRHCGAQVKP